MSLIKFSKSQSHIFNGVNWGTMFSVLVALPKHYLENISENANLKLLIDEFEQLVALRGVDWIGPREVRNFNDSRLYFSFLPPSSASLLTP